MNWLRDLLLPIQGGNLAPSVDNLFMFLVWLSLFFFVLIAGLLFYSVVKFRRRSANDVTPHITHHLGLELTWTIIPLIITIGIFFAGFNGYMEAFVPPADAMEVRVTGKKWAWQFEYPNGTITLGEYAVPVNRPVKLIMSSEDVLHNFYLYDQRTKHDVVPNRYTQIWYTPHIVGQFTAQCAAYCGTGHSQMLATMKVMEQPQFEEWLETGGLGKDVPLEKIGELTYKNADCNTCHSLDGSRGTGPSWKGIYGSQHKMSDGTVVTVDDNYIRESILQPQAKIVEGYQGVMPTYQGILKERQLNGLIEFIKKQK